MQSWLLLNGSLLKFQRPLNPREEPLGASERLNELLNLVIHQTPLAPARPAYQSGYFYASGRRMSTDRSRNPPNE